MTATEIITFILSGDFIGLLLAVIVEILRLAS